MKGLSVQRAPALDLPARFMALGFIGSMIIGVSYQLVPVVLQTSLASVRLGRLSFWTYLTGLATFLLSLWSSSPAAPSP